MPSTAHDASFEVGVIPPAERRCLNCQTLMHGPYCFQCGQHEKSSIRHFGVFVRDVIDDVFNLDSRAVRTIKPLLFAPGFLTKEYLSGRRMRYVPPLRLYVIASLMFFLLVGLIVPRDAFQFNVGIDKNTAEKIAQQLVATADTPDVIALRKSAEFEKLFVRAQNHALWTDEQKKDFANDMQDYLREKASKDFKTLVNNIRDDMPDETTSAAKNGSTIRRQTDTSVSTPAPPVDNVEVKTPKRQKDQIVFFGGITQEQNPWLFSLQERANARWQQLKSDPAQIKENVFRLLPQSMFIMLPLFAFILKLFYPFSNRLYSEHLITAVHSHSFIFLLMSGLMCLTYAGTQIAAVDVRFAPVETVIDGIAIIGWLWLPVYLWIMQYAVYGQGIVVTMLKYSVLGVVYISLLALVLVADFMISLLHY